MAVDLQEDKMINEYIVAEYNKKNGINNIDTGTKMSQSEIDEEFDNIDLTKFNNE